MYNMREDGSMNQPTRIKTREMKAKIEINVIIKQLILQECKQGSQG